MLFNKKLIHFRAAYLIVVIFFLQVAFLRAQPEEFSAENCHPQLFKVNKPDNKRFDLSGMVHWNQTLYGLADKPWNTWLYELDLNEEDSSFYPSQSIPVDYNRRPDFEAVDRLDSCFYVADERATQVIKVVVGKDTVTSEMLGLEWDTDFSGWGNAGIEGLAVNKQDGVIYIAKERDPARLFRVLPKDKKVKEFVLEKEISNEDVSDMKIENGYLYLLNRAKYRIMKFSLDTRKHIATFDYSAVLHANNQKFYSGARYPMAEALLMDNDRIWIGLDNNGRDFNEKNPYIKNAGLSEDDPVIVRFNRPMDF
ncbi:MAG: SdiA-regulated domain-containing protein [Bacteroidota bacterium]